MRVNEVSQQLPWCNNKLRCEYQHFASNYEYISKLNFTEMCAPVEVPPPPAPEEEPIYTRDQVIGTSAVVGSISFIVGGFVSFLITFLVSRLNNKKHHAYDAFGSE